MYANKGNPLHFGGYLHAAIHGIGTALVLERFGVNREDILILMTVEVVIHYLIDFSKVNVCKKFNLLPTNSNVYWILLGFDQLLHSLTYIGMVYYLVHYG